MARIDLVATPVIGLGRAHLLLLRTDSDGNQYVFQGTKDISNDWEALTGTPHLIASDVWRPLSALALENQQEIKIWATVYGINIAWGDESTSRLSTATAEVAGAVNTEGYAYNSQQSSNSLIYASLVRGQADTKLPRGIYDFDVPGWENDLSNNIISNPYRDIAAVLFAKTAESPFGDLRVWGRTWTI